jgi:hypothetical protein
MLALIRKQPGPEASQRKVKLRLRLLFSDLSLLFSLMVARFIVSRSLRLRRQERALRDVIGSGSYKAAIISG